MRNIGSQAFANCSKLETVTCQAENVPNTNTNAFDDSYVGLATLIVPAGSLNAYKTTAPWSSFGSFKTIGGQNVQKCATPTISYGGKKLTFSCETEGVSYVYEIKDADIKQGYDSEVTLTATYEISVYTTKSGYEDSDMATATLVWNSASFTETTQPATAITPAAEFMAMPVLIQSNGGMVTVQGAEDGTPVSIYTSAGMHAGSTVSHNGMATLSTSLQTGSIAIIKIGERTVKVIMK